MEQSSVEASIQASQTTHNNLNATTDELQTQFDSTRKEREQALNQLESDIATSEASLLSKQSSIADSQTTLNSLTESLSESDKELTRICGILDELNSKNEYAQVCNVQLVNESISLELQCNQQRESLAGIEAEREQLQQQIVEENAKLDTLRAEESAIHSRIVNLTKIEDSQALLDSLTETKVQLEHELANAQNDLHEINSQIELAQQNNLQLANESRSLELKAIQQRELVSQFESELSELQLQSAVRNSSLDSMRAEELKLENRIANLLTQAGKFDCLSVATSETLSYAQEQERSEQHRIVSDLQEQKASLDQALIAIQSQIEAERTAAEKLSKDASKIHADAEKSLEDAERRVHLLNEKANTLVEQVQNRSAELFAIKQEMIELRAEVRDLEATNLELKEVELELEGLKAHLAEQRAQMDAIAAQIADGEAAYGTQLQSAVAIEKQIANLESQLQIVSDEFLNRTQAIEQLTAQQDAILAKNRELVDQKDALDFTIHKSCDTKDELSKRIEALREEAKSQREQISQLEAERSALESDLMDLTSTVQLLQVERNQLDGETEQLRELAGQRSAIEEEVADVTANIESLTQQQNAAIELLNLREQSIRETELKLNNLRNEFAELEQQRAETIAAQARATQELAETAQLQQTASEKHDAVVHQTEAIQKRLCELQSEFDSLTTQQNSASAALQKAIEEVNDAQSVAKQWGTYIDSLKLEVESQRKVNTDLQRSIESLRKGESQSMIDMERAACEVESLLEQKATLIAANQSQDLTLRAAQRELDEAAEKRAALQQDLLDKQRLLSEVTNQLVDTNAELLRAEAGVNAAVVTQSSLENQILEVQATLGRIASDHENHLSRVRDLVEEQQFLETSIRGLNKQVSESESVIASLDSRKNELEMELSQQQASYEIAVERSAALESEIESLNSEVAAIQVKKHELAILESDCNARTAILNALCEESALEQSRLRELKEQIASAQQMLADSQEQRADTSSECARLELQTLAIKQALELANVELQDTLESKATAETLIGDFNQELKRFTEEKKSVEREIQKLSENLNIKLIALQATQDEASVAEIKALELWATISELQALGAELDRSLNSKRESIAQANAEMIKFDEMREATLAQKQSLERSVHELTARLNEGQNSKEALDQEIATLTANFDRLQIEIANANTELEQLAKQASESSTIAQSVSSDTSDSTQAISGESELNPGTLEMTAFEPTSLQESESEFTQQEEDIWTSLGELARLGKTVRIDVDRAKLDTPLTVPPRPVEAVSIPGNPEVDAWETVFSPFTLNTVK